MLGNYLKHELDKKGLSYKDLSRDQMDISNIQAVERCLSKLKFSTFIHLAAETNVDLCETNTEHAYKCNYYTTRLIAKRCKELDARLIFISTSGVFQNDSSLQYSELDQPVPKSIYSKSKYFAEQAIREICTNYFIIRSSWMIGGGSKLDNKFVGKVINKLRASVTELTAVNDRYGSITSGKHLAKFIVNTFDFDFVGVKHFASIDFCSRYDIAKLLADLLKPTCKVLPTSSASYPLAAPRALSEAFCSIVPQSLLPCPPMSWEALVTEYVKEEFDVIK